MSRKENFTQAHRSPVRHDTMSSAVRKRTSQIKNEQSYLRPLFRRHAGKEEVSAADGMASERAQF